LLLYLKREKGLASIRGVKKKPKNLNQNWRTRKWETGEPVSIESEPKLETEAPVSIAKILKTGTSVPVSGGAKNIDLRGHFFNK
jgi:hypothetical protein